MRLTHSVFIEVLSLVSKEGNNRRIQDIWIGKDHITEERMDEDGKGCQLDNPRTEMLRITVC